MMRRITSEDVVDLKRRLSEAAARGQWWTKTWNLVAGCAGHVSSGCDNCWAEQMHNARHRGEWKKQRRPKQYDLPFNVTRTLPGRLRLPASWRKPQVIAVCLTSDLFGMGASFVRAVFRVMTAPECEHHTFCMLTKRSNSLEAFFAYQANELIDRLRNDNLWYGVTVETAGVVPRVARLCSIAGINRFVSAEPLLGPIVKDLWSYWGGDLPGIHAVFAGGETGKNARPMRSEWVTDLRDLCKCADVPFLLKQWGEWIPHGQLPAEVPFIGYLNDEGALLASTDDGARFNKLGRYMGREGDEQAVYRLGRRRTGRLLDGQTHDALPALWTDRLEKLVGTEQERSNAR
jgi:protein gp37